MCILFRHKQAFLNYQDDERSLRVKPEDEVVGSDRLELQIVPNGQQQLVHLDLRTILFNSEENSGKRLR